MTLTPCGRNSLSTGSSLMPLAGKAKRAYQRKWIAARRAAFFQDKRCVQCGANENLELDHINESSKVSHKIWSWTSARREAELAKCQPLCKDCHQKKSDGQKRARQTGRPLSPQHRRNMSLGQRLRDVAAAIRLASAVESTAPMRRKRDLLSARLSGSSALRRCPSKDAPGQPARGVNVS
jgi:5-methylcytosine-specific restriction endonuclease McrA